ncbi:MAG: Ran-binding zinc finger domain-containing protein [Candidatus Promineifilaceae bacterium]
MAVREGRWDCQYCGKTGILGRDKACPSCGRSRPEGTKFYLPKEGEEVADEKLVQQAKIGPDWICEFCGSSNPANVDVCGSCQAPRESVSPKQAVKEYGVGEAPSSGDMDLSTPPERPTTTEPAKKSKATPAIGIAGVIGAIILLCICIGLAFLIFGNRNAEATVSGFSWERTVAVESFQTVTEEDWAVPEGGRILSQQQEIHHYDQVLDHYETRSREVSEQVQVGERTYVCGQRDLGNGFFEDVECTDPVYETQTHTETYDEPIYRDEPVYQTKYTYEIDKWVVVRTEDAGNNDHNASWPATNLADGEREGERTETYTVYFTDEDGKSYEWETTEDSWRGFETGQGVKLKLDALGNNVEEVET